MRRLHYNKYTKIYRLKNAMPSYNINICSIAKLAGIDHVSQTNYGECMYEKDRKHH